MSDTRSLPAFNSLTMAWVAGRGHTLQPGLVELEDLRALHRDELQLHLLARAVQLALEVRVDLSGFYSE